MSFMSFNDLPPSERWWRIFAARVFNPKFAERSAEQAARQFVFFAKQFMNKLETFEGRDGLERAIDRALQETPAQPFAMPIIVPSRLEDALIQLDLVMWMATDALVEAGMPGPAIDVAQALAKTAYRNPLVTEAQRAMTFSDALYLGGNYAEARTTLEEAIGQINVHEALGLRLSLAALAGRLGEPDEYLVINTQIIEDAARLISETLEQGGDPEDLSSLRVTAFSGALNLVEYYGKSKIYIVGNDQELPWARERYFGLLIASQTALKYLDDGVEDMFGMRAYMQSMEAKALYGLKKFDLGVG